MRNKITKLTKAINWLRKNEDLLLRQIGVSPNDISATEITGEKCPHTGDITAWINYDHEGDTSNVKVDYKALEAWFSLATPYNLSNIDINVREHTIHICIIAG